MDMNEDGVVSLEEMKHMIAATKKKKGPKIVGHLLDYLMQNSQLK